MRLRLSPMSAFVFLTAATLPGPPGQAASSQARPANTQARPVILLSGSAIQDGTRYWYEVSPERASRLPQWDQRVSREPPLPTSEARRAGETWLGGRAPEVKAFDLTSLNLLRSNVEGLWHYRLTFDPIVGGRRLPGGRDYTVLVLLDGSIVEPRVETVPATSAAGRGTTTVPAVPAAPGTAPVRVGGAIVPPSRIKNVNPVYPPAAQSDRVQGVVIIEATIGTDGHVTDATVIRSIPMLDAAALDAVRQWQYTPTMMNGVPISVIMTVTVSFTLQ